MKFRSVIQDAFSTAEAALLSSLTPRQLDHWARQGFLAPSIQEAAGYGSRRRYSFSDVVKLRVAARLRASGVGLARIRRCVEALKRLDSTGQADLDEARLVVTGDRVLWARSDREVVDLLRGGQLVLVFPVAGAVEETFGAVARLNKEFEDARGGAPRPRAARHGKHH
ncbi:MAG TPA: MerR family transcriptional regulator [Thermoanaerobaculia bacterium]|nr:MerR family transcriptional regulator [Thermoanaerobaculia bacterium]